MKERWKDIKGYEGRYQVSNFGRVKSLARKASNNHMIKERILKPLGSGCDYLRVNLCKDGHSYRKLIHRLVAETFIPNLSNLPMVNHKDEDKTNNCVENLEWCTAKYNTNYGHCIEERAKKVAKAESKKVVQLSLDGKLVNVWSSTNEAGRHGYWQSAVVNCCLRKRKTHCGYIWRYYTDYTRECKKGVK